MTVISLLEFGDEIGVSLRYHTVTILVWSFWERFTAMLFLGRGVRSVVRLGIQLINFVSYSKQGLLSVGLLL